MREFSETNILNANGLEYLVQKYKEKNPIARMLIANFYRAVQKVVSLLEPADQVLEVGCGAGLSSLRIYRMLHGRHFEVSDIDSNIIDQFGNLGFPIPFKQESVLELKRHDREFDCVFLLEVLEHVPEYNQALRELFRVSRKYVVVSTPNEPLWRILNLLRGKYLRNFGNTPGHVNHWSSRELIKLISDHGTVMQIYKPLPWTIVVAKVPPNEND